MELIDGDDIKQELINKSARHRQEIEGDFKLITENTEKIITNALIIGGTLAFTYYLVRQVTGGSSKKKSKRKPTRLQVVSDNAGAGTVAEEVSEPASMGLVGQLGTALASQASIFLLNLAKEKLMEYLDERAQKKQQG